jgi:hypothetical protein
MVKVWRWPLLIGVSSLVGLVAGLLGEGGVWWWICWLTLSVPVALGAMGLARAARGSGQLTTTFR